MFLDFCVIELTKQKQYYIIGVTDEFLAVPKHLSDYCNKYIIGFSANYKTYVLYEFIYTHENFSSKYITKISDDLKNLLFSAIKYPPIIAISKEIFSNMQRYSVSTNHNENIMLKNLETTTSLDPSVYNSNKRIISVKDFEYIYIRKYYLIY